MCITAGSYVLHTSIRMSAVKTKAMTLRVTPTFKRLLDLAASRERRSRTNLIEKLVIEHCRTLGLTDLELDQVVAGKTKARGGTQGA